MHAASPAKPSTFASVQQGISHAGITEEGPDASGASLLSTVLKLKRQASGGSSAPPPAWDNIPRPLSLEQHTPRRQHQVASRACTVLMSTLRMPGVSSRNMRPPSLPQTSTPQPGRLMDDAHQAHGTISSCSTAPGRLTVAEKLQRTARALQARRTAQSQKEALLHAETKACSPVKCLWLICCNRMCFLAFWFSGYKLRVVLPLLLPMTHMHADTPAARAPVRSAQNMPPSEGTIPLVARRTPDRSFTVQQLRQQFASRSASRLHLSTVFHTSRKRIKMSFKKQDPSSTT